MRNILFCLLVLSFMATIAAVASGQTRVPDSGETLNLQQVLDNHLQAIGGRQAVDRVHSVRASGDITADNGISIPYTIEFMPPQLRMRMDFVVQGVPASTAFDGESGWSLPPLVSVHKPQPLQGEQLQQVRQQADFFGALINSENKGYQLELLGQQKLDSQAAIAIQAKSTNGELQTWYLDPASWLPIAVSATDSPDESAEPVTPQTITIYFSDYRQIGDITWPFSIRSDYGQAGEQVNNIERLQFNVELNEQRFFAEHQAAT